MNGITWISGETAAERYLRLEHSDPRGDLPFGHLESVEWLREASAACNDLVEEYLYSFIFPAQLPDILKKRILSADYTVVELDQMAAELKEHEKYVPEVVKYER